jgi:hypothetical protein
MIRGVRVIIPGILSTNWSTLLGWFLVVRVRELNASRHILERIDIVGSNDLNFMANFEICPTAAHESLGNVRLKIEHHST